MEKKKRETRKNEKLLKTKNKYQFITCRIRTCAPEGTARKTLRKEQTLMKSNADKTLGQRVKPLRQGDIL